MSYKTCWWHYSLFALLGSVLIGTASGVGAANPTPDNDDLKTRGPAGTVKIAPEPAGATPKPASFTPQNGQKPLNFKINYVYRPGGQGPLKSLAEGSVLNSGDHYKIQFTPAEDSYVYIFQVDSSKAIYRLFPMTSFSGVKVDNLNPVQAGVTYHLPAKDKSFKLDNNIGSESIIFLAFRQPNGALEQQYESLVKARLAQDRAKADKVQTAIKSNFKTRGLAAIVDDPEKKTATVPWALAESFAMPVQHLDNLCADCINMMTFGHR